MSMRMFAVIVDQIPESCAVCIFRPTEQVGTIGNIANSYCTILHEPMAEDGIREDCPLIEVEPDYMDVGA